MILNRLEKNSKKLIAWSEKYKIQAYRLYDRDIPEFPFIVDRYNEDFVIYDKSEKIDENKNHLPALIEALKTLFKIEDNKIIIKKRQKQKGTEQYTKLATTNEKKIVLENGIPLLVNLHDYLDTGLFLDHRPMRYQFLKKSKNVKMLNLFCYTASVSVMAAMGGAITCSVDMSGNYLDWAKENFKLNQIDLNRHTFHEDDVLQFIENACVWHDYFESFDVIFLDPPTFSNSKSMKTDFDVERDQVQLVHQVLKFLKPQGVLYFSNNKRDFKISQELSTNLKIKDITLETIPIDFHDKKIHKCFEIRKNFPK